MKSFYFHPVKATAAGGWFISSCRWKIVLHSVTFFFFRVGSVKFFSFLSFIVSTGSRRRNASVFKIPLRFFQLLRIITWRSNCGGGGSNGGADRRRLVLCVCMRLRPASGFLYFKSIYLLNFSFFSRNDCCRFIFGDISNGMRQVNRSISR